MGVILLIPRDNLSTTNWEECAFYHEDITLRLRVSGNKPMYFLNNLTGHLVTFSLLGYIHIDRFWSYFFTTNTSSNSAQWKRLSTSAEDSITAFLHIIPSNSSSFSDDLYFLATERETEQTNPYQH